ncbi:MAG: SCO family protein [Deltaproteobacteria bacterium]
MRRGAPGLLALALLASAAARAEPPVPPAVRAVAVDERLGERLPLALQVVDAQGHPRSLSDYFHPGRPVILALVYYHCPMLCSLLLQGLAHGLRALSWVGGKSYEALALSVDPAEPLGLAAEKQRGYLEAIGQPGDTDAWQFLTAPEETIVALTQALGFRYAYDPQTKSYAHGSVLFVLSPDGKLTRYLYGLEFPEQTLRLALTEAGEGKVGSSLDRILLTCYHYDPATRRYGFFVFGFLRTGGALVFGLLATMLGRYWWRELRPPRQGEAPGRRP